MVAVFESPAAFKVSKPREEDALLRGMCFPHFFGTKNGGLAIA
jgi:hypothetical protein